MIHYGKGTQGRVIAPGEDISHPSKVYQRPRVTVAPSITPVGPVVVGAVLTVTPGTWLNFATVLGEWQRDTGTFLKLGSSPYTVVAEDVGHSISYVERATAPAGPGASSRTNAVVVT